MDNVEDGDLLVFRRNSYLYFLISFFTCNLDNYFGIYKKEYNVEYIYGYNIYFDNYIPKLKLKKTEFDSLMKEEFYIHKKPNINVYNDSILKEDNLQNYTISITNINILNLWFNKFFGICLYNEKLFKILEDYYGIPKFNYNALYDIFPEIYQVNFNKKHNYLYLYATGFIFLTDIGYIYYLGKSVSIYLFFIMSGILYNYITLFKPGKRFIGVLNALSILKILFNYDICNINPFKLMSRFPIGIYAIRIVNWYNNDIYGIQNIKTKRPYDTGIIEAYFTGFVPMLLLSSIPKEYYYMYFLYIYGIVRFFIEFFKQKYHIYKGTLTLGQMDSLFTIVFSYLYFNHYNELLTVFVLLFYDINMRLLNIAELITMIDSRYVRFDFITKKNRGFSLGSFRNINNTFKVMVNVSSLSLLYYTTNSTPFVLCGFVNCFERLYSGYVTDYIFIKFLNLSFVCNISDILLFYYTMLYTYY